jgi:hypothetical protein
LLIAGAAGILRFPARVEAGMKRVALWVVVGAFTGAVVATLMAPWVLQTFLATTGAKDAMCQCSELVANTASTLIQTQLWGAVTGAVVMPILAWLAKRLWGKRGGDIGTAPGPDAAAPHG